MKSVKRQKEGKKKISEMKNPFQRPGKLTEETIMNCREYLTYRRVMYLDSIIMAPAADTILSLLMLDDISHDPITIIMYCPGGGLDAGFAICDVMEQLRSPIVTVGFSIQSMAVPLFMCGDKRLLSNHARVMLHLPFGMTQGDARDFDIANTQMQKFKSDMVEFLISKGLKGSKKAILKEIDRDNWMTADEAIEKGIGHEILTAKHYRNLIK